MFKNFGLYAVLFSTTTKYAPDKGGAGKGAGMIYLNGEPAYKLGNENLVDHIVELCEKKAAEIEAARGKLEAAQ